MQVCLLGPIDVVGVDSSSHLNRLQQRRLLSALSVQQGQVVSEDRLVEVLWAEGEELPANPRGALQTYVSRLRSLLGAASIVTRSPGYLLDGGVEIDAVLAESLIHQAAGEREQGDLAAAAEALERALDLWRGDSLGDLAGEEWAVGDAVRFDEMRLGARDELADVLIESGRQAEAVADLEALVETHPLRERSWGLLMLALHGSGRQAEALRTFDRYRNHLAEETGLDPSPELAELQQRILERDPQLEVKNRPRRLAGYELGDLVGEGAFGVIYQATQPSVGREVAIKVVKSELANDPAFVRRFEVEAQTVARLEHPHIVPLHDFWRDPSGAYLVMRLLRGGSVEERLVREGPWRLEDVARLVEEIGAALAVAHDMGVVHRDVKPGNVLFDEAGNSYLTDFGIAAAVRGSDVLDLRSAGSPLYVSPEQVRDGEASPLSDIYALGVMVFELLTGAVPFGDSESVQRLFERKLREVVPSIRDTRPDVPEAVDLVVQTATATDPTARFASMGEMVLAFRAAAGSLSGASTTGGVHPDRPRQLASQTFVSIQMEGINPFKGLAAFDEADSEDFYGRTDLIAELVAHLQGSRFLVVTGPSGSGKSSVVRAGLLPELRRGGSFVASMIPGVHPMDELETALLRLATQPLGALLDQLTADERGLGRAVKRVLPDEDAELVLIIDQFEELFTLTSETQRNEFLEALAHAIADERSRLRVVVTLRADFYDRPLQHPAVSDLVRVNTIAVSTLNAEELNAAISRPAERVGVTIEPALAAEARGEAASLPLLQYALTEVYERRSNGVMTVAAYREIGGITGALARRADDIHDALDEVGRNAVRRLFTRLITPGEGTEDTRRRVLQSELAGIDQGILDAYGNARLLTFDRDPSTREPTVEVAHEAIIREWPTLRAWLDDDRDGLRILRHLHTSAAEWETTGRPSSELYSGGRLEAAEDWAEDNRDDLTDLESNYLELSLRRRVDEQVAERQRIRRLRTLLSTTAVVAAIALVAGAIAFQQRGRASDKADEAQISAELASQRRTDAETRRLASEAGFRVQTDRQVGLLLAAEAYNRDPGPVSLGALQRALTGIGTYAGTLESGVPYAFVEWLDEDRIIAVGSVGVAVVDRHTAEVLESYDVPARVDHVENGDAAFVTRTFVSAGGDVVALVSAEDSAFVRLLGIGERQGLDLGLPHDGEVDGLEVSPDGRRLATIDQDDVVRMWDIDTQSLLWQVTAHPEGSFSDLDTDEDVDFVASSLQTQGGKTFNIEKIRHHLRFSADGSELISQESILRRWDAATGDQLGADVLLWRHRPETGSTRIISHPLTTFMGDWREGRVLIHDQGGLTIVDIRSGEVISTSEIEEAGDRYGLAKIDTVQWDGGDTAWVLLSTGRALHVRLADGTRVEPAIDTQLFGASDLAVSPSGTVAAVAGISGIGLFALDGSRAIATAVPRDGTNVGSVTPDGALVTQDYSDYGDEDRPGQVLDMSGGRPVEVLRPDNVVITHVAGFGSMFVAATPQYNMQPRDLETLEPLGPTLATAGGWNGQAATLDNRWLAAGTLHAGIRVFDVESGEIVRELGEVGNGVPSLSFNADGSRLAAVSIEGQLVVWDTRTWSPIYDEAPVVSVRYSPDGKLLVTMQGDGSLALRDPDTHEIDEQFVGLGSVGVPDAPFYFRSDGKYLVSTPDGAPRLWDLEAGEQIGDPFPNDPDNLIGGADGSPLLVTAVDGYRLIWDLRVDSWREIACQLAGRNLTLAEWDQFGPTDQPHHATCPEWPPVPESVVVPRNQSAQLGLSEFGADILADQAAAEVLPLLQSGDEVAAEQRCEEWEVVLFEASDTAEERESSVIADQRHRFWNIDQAIGLCAGRSFERALVILQSVDADPFGACVGYPSPCAPVRE